MKVTGGATVRAPVAAVWAALADPAVLVQVIPGCERLTATAPDTYELTVTAGVGTITGTYTGRIALTDQQPPTALTLRANGSGTPGTVTTSVLVRLAEETGGTLVSYDADATIGGLIAGVGQRMLAGVAKRQAGQFFAALDELLLAQAEAAAGPTAGVGLEPPAGVTAEQAAGMEGERQTWERTPMKGQPAGRRLAAPQLAGRRGAALPTAGFLPGVLVGAGIALAGVVVGGLIARRKR